MNLILQTNVYRVMKHLFKFCCLVVCVGASHLWALESPDQPPVIESAGLKIWPQEKRVTLEGEICAASALVEFFTVTTYGHKYESVIAVKCRPSQLHTALVMIGGVDRASLRKKQPNMKENDPQVSRFVCQVSWDLPDRYVSVEPYEQTRHLKPQKLYALTIEDPGTEDEWIEVSPWKIYWNPESREGQIIFEKDMPELIDPEDPLFYWRNHVRREAITEKDEVLYYFDQPTLDKKGKFKPFGLLKTFREEPRHYSVPAGDLVKSLESDEPLGHLKWLFSGSLIDKESDEQTGQEKPFYIADRTGVVMQLMPDDFAVLDSSVKLPKLDNRIGTAFEVNENICPPLGTPVLLTFHLKETKTMEIKKNSKE